MSEHSAELLRKFESLPPAEQQEFMLEILRRAREFPLDSGVITDDEIGESGRSLFESLDREEDAARTR